MIKVYFDDVLIDGDCYASLSNEFELFNNSFYLGSTASNTYKIAIGKEAISTQPSEVKIYDDTTLIATLVVDNIEEDDYSYIYTLTDKMVNLEFYYDASEIFINGSATLLQIALDICQKAGITLGTQNFRGYNKNITWYDNRITAREYIGYIAELNGGYAQIGTDGKLYFKKQNTNSVLSVNIDECEDFKIGERHEITRVVYELGTLKYEFGNETGNTLYLNSENVFITEESEVQAIYQELHGFTFYNFETSNCPIDFNVKAGDIVVVEGENEEYPIIAGYELTYYGGWYGGYSLNVDSQKQEETKTIGLKDKIKQLSVVVDRNTNTITQLVQETDDHAEKLTQQQQDIDSIKNQVSSKADYKREVEGVTEIHLENANNLNILELQIKGNKTYEANLYPSDDLYPSNDLYPNMEGAELM